MIQESFYNSDGALEDKYIYKYDSNNILTYSYDYEPDGTLKYVTSYEYHWDDSRTREIKFTTGLWEGFSVVYKYDNYGKIIEALRYNDKGEFWESPYGGQSKFVYDSRNNLIEEYNYNILFMYGDQQQTNVQKIVYQY